MVSSAAIKKRQSLHKLLIDSPSTLKNLQLDPTQISHLKHYLSNLFEDSLQAVLNTGSNHSTQTVLNVQPGHKTQTNSNRLSTKPDFKKEQSSSTDNLNASPKATCSVNVIDGVKTIDMEDLNSTNFCDNANGNNSRTNLVGGKSNSSFIEKELRRQIVGQLAQKFMFGFNQVTRAIKTSAADCQQPALLSSIVFCDQIKPDILVENVLNVCNQHNILFFIFPGLSKFIQSKSQKLISSCLVLLVKAMDDSPDIKYIHQLCKKFDDQRTANLTTTKKLLPVNRLSLPIKQPKQKSTMPIKIKKQKSKATKKT